MLLVVVGLVAGTLAGLLGIGGGVIMVPAMVMVLGLTPAVAKGTSAAVIVPTAFIGHDPQPRRTATPTCASPSSSERSVPSPRSIGASISDRLSDATSNVLFAVLLVAVAITQLRDVPRTATDDRLPSARRRAHRA